MVEVLFIGGSSGPQVLAAIARTRHRVTWVIDSEAPGSGASLSDMARARGLTVWPPAAVKEPSFPATVAGAGVEVIISIRSRAVLPAALIAAPRFGSYNLHTGPLPAYAGRNVISWAIYNGETEHGVTLHEMVAEIDRGGIVSAARFPIGPEDTALTVTRRCLTAGLPLVIALLDHIEDHGAPPPVSEQDPRLGRLYTAKERPDMRLDWRRPVGELVNLSRACAFFPFPSPWGLPVASLGGRQLEVVRLRRIEADGLRPPGEVIAIEGESAIVATGDGAVRLESFLVGGQPVPAAEIVAAGSRFDYP